MISAEALLRIKKDTKYCNKAVFFPYSLAKSMQNLARIFTGLLFYAYVGIHQVRILVFDNCQICLVPLKEGIRSVITLHSGNTELPGMKYV